MNASPRPAVVADSTSGLPAAVIAEHDISVVSLYVGLEGKQERESEIADLNEFYERLRASEETVTTSQPSIGDFIEIYEPLLADGRDVVSVHLSAGISGTYESAVQARDRLSSEGKGGERIHVVDSKTAAAGMGLVLLAAARAADEGVEEMLAKANQAIDDVKVWFAVNTLEYLRRGGRIGSAGAWLGTTLQIKPILTFAEEVEPVERVRTRAKSLERLVGYARSRHEDGYDGWVVQHIQDPDAAERMVEECKGFFGSDPVFVTEIGPVLGAHVGPGLIGVGATSLTALSL